ncbi:MAG: phosphate regulon transcriptional regulator PhoB [Gammaproteobacteria bacterium]|nr:phosphate regulon transcriptional regulator PhoB [Gammaproteobacteria bacterium]
MTEITILVVDDESAIRDMLSKTLHREGFRVTTAADATEAMASVVNERPDIVLLDWMLPDISGVELARQWKREEMTRDLPIIMLTARVEEDDKIRGLESGADDYVTKPFSPRELMARINAVLRRTQPERESTVNFKGLELDIAGQRISANGDAVIMGPTEYKLLQFFMTHPERVYTRDQLIDRVWGGNVYIEDRTVDVHIRRLRKALNPAGYDHFIQTVRGSGYRFSTQV